MLDRIEAKKKRGKVNVQRFKGLGEMNPMQLRETTMNPDTRRLEPGDGSSQMLDMLLAKSAPAIGKRGWRRKGIWRRRCSGCSVAQGRAHPLGPRSLGDPA